MSKFVNEYFLASLLVLLVFSTFGGTKLNTNAQDNCRTFPETDKTVCGRFLEYWSEKGGLRQQGLPISDLKQEVSEIDGKTYAVQYFERAVFELHPENARPHDVLLSLLGSFRYEKQWGNPYWPVQQANRDNPLVFAQTGKTIGGIIRTYWERNGGLAQQGYPISNEFVERSPVDDKLHTVQYFERAVLEYHPENEPHNNILLSLLGRYRYSAKYEIPATPTPATGVESCREARSRRGTPIAQGTNTVPTTRAKLKTFRIEEIVLSRPVNCPVLVPTQRFWRVIVSAEGELFNYPGGGDPFGIWVDDTLLGTAGVIPGEGYTTIVFDLQVLREGGMMSVGFPGTSRDVLPEKLVFNKVP